jgi:hypothetical protein
MHEFSEMVQFAVPVASVGGIAAIVRAVRARRARELRRTTVGPLEPDILQDLSGKGSEEDHHGRLHNG